MRLWTIHPSYLDPQGLVALWREALLAQAVLLGRTKGYRNHPQLIRFRQQRSPVACISRYLKEICREAARRGYEFDHTKIAGKGTGKRIAETRGQLLYEWKHFLAKVKKRNPAFFHLSARIRRPMPHPLFRIVHGQVQNWEKKNKISGKP
jgi:hypothetical protein